jgi:natural product precursor
MKKQIKKLSLSKRTISNLNSSEMSRLIGGKTGGCHYGGNSKECSKNCTENGGSTCPGHNTCYNC